MKTHFLLWIAVTCLLISLSNCDVALQSTKSYLTPADRVHLRSVLQPGLGSNDVISVYYSVLGYKLLGEPLSKKQEICEFLVKTINEGNNITAEKAFYLSSVWKTIDTCQDPGATVATMATLTKILMAVLDKETSTIVEIYYATSGLTALSEKISRDKVEKITKVVENTLSKDDSLWNLGYTFHIASDIETMGVNAFDRNIEDAIIQADEVDGQYLQFEGGLSITSFLVNGIFKLSSKLKKKPPVSLLQTVKFANYLLSRRSVQTPKGVTNLLSALTALAANEFDKPICITLADNGNSISSQQPQVIVKVSDIFGSPLASPPKLVPRSATRIGGDALVLNEKTFQPSPADKTLFTLNLMEINPERGFYKITVAVGPVTSTVTVKVLCDLTVSYLEIGTADADQATQPNLTRIAYPEKLRHKVEADSQQNLVMQFVLRDAANKKPMRVHQAFVRLSSVSESNVQKRGHEIIFVAEPDAWHNYNFDMRVGSAAANFGHQGGDYKIELIVGDAVLTHPIQWSVATVSLKFPEQSPNEVAGDKSASFGKPRGNAYSSKPEIKHMFREPEKRPPAFVSNLFTGLCLAPVLLLLILWAKLGVNISNFPISVSACTFHLGLGSIFVLFGIFWLKLDMFVTLRYLLGLGVVTFLAGNKMLSRIAHKHKAVR